MNRCIAYSDLFEYNIEGNTMRIAVDSRVSTECWRFDRKHDKEADRWSYSKFGEKWQDSRVIGTVRTRGGGDRWHVKWDIDGSITEISTQHLHKENDSIPIQGYINFTDQKGEGGNPPPPLRRPRVGPFWI